MEKEYKGYNGSVILGEKSLVIKRGGLRGVFLGGGIRGDKTIPYSSIVAVQLKKAGITNGYIQFTLMGGSEAKGGLFQSMNDENSVSFSNFITKKNANNEKFSELKKLVEERMGLNNPVVNQYSPLDEIAKLAGLRDNGIITEEEFQQKKKQLLDY